MIDVSQLQNSTLDKMIALLKEIFQYDKVDLDFGMYRIINLRKQEIQQFIETKLTESIKKYTIALENVKESDTMQKNIDFLCNHIINFFQRYYDAGDFISKRRYSKTGVYSIPYNGENLFIGLTMINIILKQAKTLGCIHSHTGIIKLTLKSMRMR